MGRVAWPVILLVGLALTGSLSDDGAGEGEPADEAPPEADDQGPTVETLILHDALMFEGVWVVDDDKVAPYRPPGFEPSAIFLGGPFPPGTAGLHVQPIRYESATLGEVGLPAGHLVYWGTYVDPPPEHDGSHEANLIWTAVASDNPEVVEWLRDAGVPRVEEATIQIDLEDLAVHRAAVGVEVTGFSYEVSLDGDAVHSNGCHQCWASMRFFGVEDGQVRSTVDATRDATSMTVLGNARVTYEGTPNGAYPGQPIGRPDGFASRQVAPATITLTVTRAAGGS